MQTTNIEFAAYAAPKDNGETPWSLKTKSTYEDRVIKPEYTDRILRFPVGQTWFRIIPDPQPKDYRWLMPVWILKHTGGRFAHPRTLRNGAKCIYDLAYSWLREHQPETLYSKSNKAGIRLLTDPLAVFWIITEIDGESVLRLVVESGYDGFLGGVLGLGHRILKETIERDENNQIVADAAHPDNGLLVSVEKSQPKGVQYPNYRISLGRQPHPVSAHLAKLAPEEIEALCPLRNVIRELSDEEQWACLERDVAPETVGKIRESLTTR